MYNVLVLKVLKTFKDLLDVRIKSFLFQTLFRLKAKTILVIKILESLLDLNWFGAWNSVDRLGEWFAFWNLRAFNQLSFCVLILESGVWKCLMVIIMNCRSINELGVFFYENSFFLFRPLFEWSRKLYQNHMYITPLRCRYF